MAASRPLRKLQNAQLLSRIPDIASRVSSISTTSCVSIGSEWKTQRRQPKGPLVDWPDYSFVDGRPTPLGSGQFRRMTQQQEIVNKIVELTKEVDFAVERHKKSVQDEQEWREGILSNKLKEKGQTLLKSPKQALDKENS